MTWLRHLSHTATSSPEPVAIMRGPNLWADKKKYDTNEVKIVFLEAPGVLKCSNSIMLSYVLLYMFNSSRKIFQHQALTLLWISTLLARYLLLESLPGKSDIIPILTVLQDAATYNSGTCHFHLVTIEQTLISALIRGLWSIRITGAY